MFHLYHLLHVPKQWNIHACYTICRQMLCTGNGVMISGGFSSGSCQEPDRLLSCCFYYIVISVFSQYYSGVFPKNLRNCQKQPCDLCRMLCKYHSHHVLDRDRHELVICGGFDRRKAVGLTAYDTLEIVSSITGIGEALGLVLAALLKKRSCTFNSLALDLKVIALAAEDKDLGELVGRVVLEFDKLIEARAQPGI